MTAVESFLSSSPYVDHLDQKSCFVTDYSQISSSGYKAIIGLDFSESVFMHAILHSGDHYLTNNAWDPD